MSFLQFCKEHQHLVASLSFHDQRDELCRHYVAGTIPSDVALEGWLQENKLEATRSHLLEFGWHTLALLKEDFDVEVDIADEFPKRYRARFIKAILNLQGKQVTQQEEEQSVAAAKHVVHHHVYHLNVKPMCGCYSCSREAALYAFVYNNKGYRFLGI
jgi:hypothetical protein